MDSISPIIMDMLGIAVTGIIAFAANTIRQKYNIEIEEKYRVSLHQAIMSGINAGLARLGSPKGPLSPSVKTQLVDDAVAHVHRSVPDAIQALKPSPEVLGTIAASKLNEALMQYTPVVTQTEPQ